ncbi:MAG: PepSY domain-containing protein [Dehalococcoidia bacterium]
MHALHLGWPLAVAVTALGAATFAAAAPSHQAPSGQQSEAVAAALRFTGGGEVESVENGPRRSYEVEITLDDGRSVEVTVNRQLQVTWCEVDDPEEEPTIDPGDCGFYAPQIDARNFVPRITNPYLPLKPGSKWTYQSTDGQERIEVEVLSETRSILGVTATVVRDLAYEDGELVEATFDWYAQDKDGAVWYLGEDTAEIKDGQIINRHGAWEAGVDGAKPGIAMLANPRAGNAYRQEFLEGEAEDMAQVLRSRRSLAVAGHTYSKLIVTAEWTPLVPEVVEHKTYAPGVGLVREDKVRGGSGRVELVAYIPAP